MMGEIIIIAVIISAACAIPGVFLILRRMSLISDAISHSVLFGIVIVFFLVKSLHSPLLVAGAVLTGILTVFLSEMLLKTRLLKEDASIGLVFPALFSIGVILISKYAGNMHLDTDAVLMGEIALAPFDRFIIGGLDLGPVSAWLMGGIGIFNLIFVILFYKELKISTFDAGLAAALGFAPSLLHYALMVTVSITAVGAFDTVGSILVVAFMIAPGASAYLLTDRLWLMLVLSIVIGIFSSVAGVLLAFALDTSIAGTMASVTGLVFLLTFLFAPQYGIIAKFILQRERKWVFAAYMLAVHLLYHEGTKHEKEESDISHLTGHLGWNEKYSRRVVATGLREGVFTRENSSLQLTDLGRATARSLMNRG
jgi:manganese/zinc/iron transport system permease protein